MNSANMSTGIHSSTGSLLGAVCLIGSALSVPYSYHPSLINQDHAYQTEFDQQNTLYTQIKVFDFEDFSLGTLFLDTYQKILSESVMMNADFADFISKNIADLF